MAEYPFVKGNASGLAVGLPDGQMGNSEVGHMNIGAGRIIYQDLTRLQKILKMVHSSKTKYYYRQLKTVRKTIQTYICGACYQMVVYTAIIHIYMAYWKWQKRMALKTCMYTHS